MFAQRTSSGAGGGAFAWCEPQPATTAASTRRNVTRVGTRADYCHTSASARARDATCAVTLSPNLV
jgi:hypothetical protein